MKQPHAYQAEGAAWLANGGVLLADEPGLGKTLQAIEACKQIGAKRILVVCPAVALGVWRDEIRDCWPEMPALYLRNVTTVPDDRFALITGYEYLLINRGAQTVIVSCGQFDALILDEAHALKNPAAKRTMLIYGPGCAGGGVASMAKHVMLLTGTPQLNHPGELFPHLRALAPDRIAEKSYAGFTARFCTKGTRTIYLKARGGRPATTKTIEFINGANRPALPDLAKRMRGFWLRRRTVDVLGQLPPLTITTRSIPAELCDTAILAQVEASDEAKMLRRALEQGDSLHEIEGHVSTLRRLLALAKVDATVSWVEDLLDQGVQKVGVWGWHVEALEQIADRLSALLITGSTPSNQRARIVERFQTWPEERVFVGQIQAAGTAITLTAASRAVFLEQAWTPSLNHQAVKRHHRIGQTRPVLADVLAVEDSIDHAVQEILARKAQDISMLEDT